MRALVVGGGAREHALCLALAADPAVTALVCAPGNAGTAMVGEQRPLAVGDPAAVAALAAELRSDLVVIGPEVPLVAGAADAVRAAGIACFGPSAAAARIEGSKSFAKDVMAAAGVPTAGARTCATAAEVDAALDAFGPPYVVKDDGLAAGKGVVVTADREAARAHAAACGTVVIEEYLDGPEVSLFCVTDGEAVHPAAAGAGRQAGRRRRHRPQHRRHGGVCAAALGAAGLVDDVLATVVQPTLAELRRRGTPFAGLLYVGLALTAAGLRVVEFNARFGDPETQAVLALLETPLAGLVHAAATGTLGAHPPLRWRDDAAVTVVVAAGGYPGHAADRRPDRRRRPARRAACGHPPPGRRRGGVQRRPGGVRGGHRRHAHRRARGRVRPAGRRGPRRRPRPLGHRARRGGRHHRAPRNAGGRPLRLERRQPVGTAVPRFAGSSGAGLPSGVR